MSSTAEQTFSLGQGPGYLFLEVSEANKCKCHAVLRHSTSSPDRRFGLCFLLKQGDLCPAAQDHFGPALRVNRCGAEAWGRAQLNLQAHSMYFVGQSDGLLSLTSLLHQERLDSTTGPWSLG